MTAAQPILLGLTGSIGMGKSTVSAMFADLGVAIWDADVAVHRLYAPDAAGYRAISDICPDAATDTGVDRAVLSAAIRDDDTLLAKIEAAIHPLVAKDRQDFIAAQTTEFILCDIPLLFENNSESGFDFTITVSASETTQRTRVMSRPGMTEEKFAFILSRQLPDADKRIRADFVIENDGSLDDTRTQVIQVLNQIRATKT